MRNFHTNFHSGCTDLYSHVWHIRCHHKGLFDFLKIAIFTELRWNLSVALIWIWGLHFLCEECHWCFEKDYINLKITVGHMGILRILVISIHEYDMPFPCFVCVLFSTPLCSQFLRSNPNLSCSEWTPPLSYTLVPL